MKEWAELAWTELETAAQHCPVALLPLGAVEEHGPHMTTGTDWKAAGELGRRVAQEADLLLLPAMPYGQVWSLADYPGTLSISDETLVSLITDLSQGLELAGVGGLVMLSAHLGNVAAMKTASRRLAERGMPSLCLFYPGLPEISAKVRTTPNLTESIVHADEIETSLLLELAPDQVDMSKAAAEYPEMPEDIFSSPDRWRQYSRSGVFGDPSKASAALGAELVAFVTARAVSLIGAWRSRHNL